MNVISVHISDIFAFLLHDLIIFSTFGSISSNCANLQKTLFQVMPPCHVNIHSINNLLND